jgi:hypothetical protein
VNVLPTVNALPGTAINVTANVTETETATGNDPAALADAMMTAREIAEKR